MTHGHYDERQSCIRLVGHRVVVRVDMRRIAIIVSVPWQIARCDGRVVDRRRQELHRLLLNAAFVPVSQL